MDEKTITAIIALVGVALSIATFFLGRFSQHKSDGEKSGEMKAALKANNDLLNDVKVELRGVRESFSDLASRVAALEAQNTIIFDELKALKRGGG